MRSGPRFSIEGHDLGYPTSFRDGSSMMAAFAVPWDAVARLIGPTGFAPASLLPGRAIVSLNCVHYTDTDCGAYEEVALAVLVQNPPAEVDGWRSRVSGLRAWRDLVAGDLGGHSWRLGVSTTLSRDCGLQMWGFPKVTGDLTFERRGDRAEMAWSQDGDLVLRYGGPATGTRAPKEVSPPVYAIHGGVPQVGHLTQRYTGVGLHLRGGVLQLGPHPIADELRGLGLPRRPLVSVWNEHLEFEMSEPHPIRTTQRGRHA